MRKLVLDTATYLAKGVHLGRLKKFATAKNSFQQTASVISLSAELAGATTILNLEKLVAEDFSTAISFISIKRNKSRRRAVLNKCLSCNICDLL